MFAKNLELAAQNELIAKVLAKDSKESLRYCIISSHNSGITYLTNAEGTFHIPFVSDEDTLNFFLPGFETTKKRVLDLRSEPEVYLSEFVPESKQYYQPIPAAKLFSYIRNASEKLRKKPVLNSLAYLQFSLIAGSQDLEFSRFYYNTLVQGSKVLDMNLKHGRSGLAANQMGLNALAPAKSLIRQAPVQNSKSFPLNPLQSSKDISYENLWNFENSKNTLLGDGVSIIFTPREKNDNTLYEGEIWIDTISFDIIKLTLKTLNAGIHPFVGNPTDTIANVGIEINIHFSDSIEEGNKLVLISYTYSFDYTGDTSFSKVRTRIINDGLIHFYDYSQAFFIPSLASGTMYDDHLKSGMTPFDSSFWKYNYGIELTSREVDKILRIAKNGVLMNYSLPQKSNQPTKSIFEENNVIWNKDSYLDLETDDNLPSAEADFAAYIYCDIDTYKDTLTFSTMTILDKLSTKFNLEYSKQNLVYQNVYFDLCEIIRLNLDEKLKKLNKIDDMNIACDVAMKDLKSITQKLKSETSHGKNIDKLKKWNDLVYNRTGADNFLIFGLKYKPKRK